MRSPGVGVDASIGLTVGEKEPVDLSVNRERGGAVLVIADSVAEIQLHKVHLETVRDQLPNVLADLDVLDAAHQRAVEAGSRALELVVYLVDGAAVVERFGQHERAGEMRGTADKLSAAEEMLDTALAAVERAAVELDHTAEEARKLLVEPGKAGDDRPVEPAAP